jgi:hypothetical protein
LSGEFVIPTNFSTLCIWGGIDVEILCSAEAETSGVTVGGSRVSWGWFFLASSSSSMSSPEKPKVKVVDISKERNMSDREFLSFSQGDVDIGVVRRTRNFGEEIVFSQSEGRSFSKERWTNSGYAYETMDVEGDFGHELFHPIYRVDGL